MRFLGWEQDREVPSLNLMNDLCEYLDSPAAKVPQRITSKGGAPDESAVHHWDGEGVDLIHVYSLCNFEVKGTICGI